LAQFIKRTPKASTMDRESEEQGRTSKDKNFLFSYQIYGFVNGLRFHG